MKRIKTLTRKEKKALRESIRRSKRSGKKTPFYCSYADLRCEDCQFDQYSHDCLAVRSAEEWKAWAEEEVY